MMDMSTPTRWPLYIILCVVSGIGLWVSWSNHRERPNDITSLQDIVFRWPLAFTLIYGLVSLARTIWLWIDPNDVSAIRMFGDPPANLVLATLTNGVLLSWVSVYVLFLYLRRHEE
jgi:hypothetical protein